MVFVTKDRRQIIDAEMLTELQAVFESVLKAWNSQLIEFNVAKTKLTRLLMKLHQKLPDGWKVERLIILGGNSHTKENCHHCGLLPILWRQQAKSQPR